MVILSLRNDIPFLLPPRDKIPEHIFLQSLIIMLFRKKSTILQTELLKKTAKKKEISGNKIKCQAWRKYTKREDRATVSEREREIDKKPNSKRNSRQERRAKRRRRRRFHS